jgi:branched-chain amino acid aminotransferase
VTLLMLNGVVMEADEAVMPATDRALTHGLGLYETLKLVGGVPVFFEEHVARLDRGVDRLGLDVPFSHEQLAEQIHRLSDTAGVPDGACRVLVTAGPPDGVPSLLVQIDVRRFPQRPLRVIAYRGVRVTAELKAMTVMQSYLAQRAAAAAGADDAILVDGDGLIFEGATSNAFVSHGGGLVTPPAEGDILPGVLRAKVEELAGADGIPVIEAWVRVGDLKAGQGLLLTSSVRGIVPVGSVDGRALTVDQALVNRLRGLVGAAEAASAQAFRSRFLDQA